MNAKHQTTPLAKQSIKFDCPTCQTRLRAKLFEAGTVDVCPACGEQFKVPGEQRLREARALEQEKAQDEEARRQEIEREKSQRRLARQESAKKTQSF